MKLVSIIFTIIFLFIFIFYLFVASKRSTLKSIWSLVTNVLTFIESFLITKLFIMLCSNNIASKFSLIIEKLLNINEEEWIRNNSIQEFTKFITIIIFGLLSFLVIFLVLLLINHLIKRVIFKVVYKKKYRDYQSKNGNIIGINILIGIGSFIIVSTAIIYPIGSINHTLKSSAKKVNYNLPNEIKPITNNIVLSIYSNGISDFLFNRVTAQKIDKVKIKTIKELKGMSTMAFALLNIAEDNNTKSNVKVVKDELNNTYLVPNFISELCSNAATRWQNGESFMGQTLEIPNDTRKDLYIELLDIISKLDRDNLNNDIDTVFEFFELLKEYNLLNEDADKNLIKVLAEDEFNEKMFLCLFTNNDFKSVLATFMNYGINTVLKELNVTSNKEYIDKSNLQNMTNEDIKNEAKIFSLAVRQIKEIYDLRNKDLTMEDYTRIANNLKEIKNSKLLNNVLYNALNKLLQNAI